MGLELRIHTVLNSYNCTDKEISELLEYLMNFDNLKSVQFTPAGYSLYKEGEYEIYRPSLQFLNSMRGKIDELKKENPGIELNLGDAEIPEDFCHETRVKDFPSRALCTGNVRNMTILPDGRVTIYEELYDHPEFIIGDLTKNSILEVWNSDKAKNLFFLSQNIINEKSACKSCNELDKCRQGSGVCWKMVMYAYGKENWDFPDPRCPQAPEMYNDICVR